MPLPLGHCLLGLSIAVSFYNKFNLKREWSTLLPMLIEDDSPVIRKWLLLLEIIILSRYSISFKCSSNFPHKFAKRLLSEGFKIRFCDDLSVFNIKNFYKLRLIIQFYIILPRREFGSASVTIILTNWPM